MSAAAAAPSVDTVAWLTSQAALLAKRARAFRWEMDLPGLLESTDTQIGFDRFGSWVLAFLALYGLFALAWRMRKGSGLEKGTMPFMAASRCIGIVHSLLVVPLSYLVLERQAAALVSGRWLDLEFLGHNTALEARVLELSVGYFVADFVHFLLFEPDLLMFFHHFFSIFMMASAGLVGQGATTGMAAILMGEITNPLQSTWTMARFAKSPRYLNLLSPVFTFAFVLIRVPLVPLWTGLCIVPSLLWGPHALAPNAAVPRWMPISWAAMSVFMTLGGWVWSIQIVKGYMKKFGKTAPTAKGTKQQETKKSL